MIAMEELLEKLKLLDYEEHFSKAFVNTFAQTLS